MGWLWCGRGVLAREVLTTRSTPVRTPRDCLSCHARCAARTGGLRRRVVIGRAPGTAHACGPPVVELRDASGVCVGMVQKTGERADPGRRVRDQPGDLLPVLGGRRAG